jgi:hypothetical protein
MGFMDTLKSVARSITGGGAKVHLEATNPTKGAAFTVQVQATVADADLKIDKVYVKVRGVETVTVEVPKPQPQPQGSAQPKVATTTTTPATEKVSRETATYDKEIAIAGPQTLTAKQDYTWQGTVEIPANVLNTYNGVNAKHEWKLLAGLSAPGNDPDSGWITIEIK